METEQIEKEKEIDMIEGIFMGSGAGSAHEKVVSKELFTTKDINQKTRLDANEMSLVNRGFWIADFLDSKGYKKHALRLRAYYQGINNLRPSLDGLSRTEFVDIFRQELNKVTEEKQGIKPMIK